MKNLEIEADKANDHLMQTLLPKELIEEENEEEQPGPSKKSEDGPETAEVSEDSDDSPAEIENPPTEESKKKK